jgi:tRNA nucleotidyltransferase (CCA-adding enzyme)
MKSTKIDPIIQRSLNEIYKQYPVMREIVEEISAQGGRIFLVGGAVRDLVLGLPIKDLDVEVHGLSLAQLEALLKRFGDVSLVGKSFGVLRYPELAIDFALPRTDRAGRKPQVAVDPFMQLEDAFARRDLTMNAMGIDLKTGALIDPFNGQEDIVQRKLRTPNTHFFTEDPLRLFRVMQFVSRFNMLPDTALDTVCARMDMRGVSRERIEKEFEKMLLQSERPSLGIRWLDKIGRLAEVLPELATTKNVAQDPRWHPEGNVFEHTMQTVDAAAQLPMENAHTRRLLLYAALCHDIGKTTTTQIEQDGTIRSIGHDIVGAALTKKMLGRIMTNKELIAAVATMVKYHMAPGQFVDNNAQPAAYKRLALKVAPYGSLALLADLALADRRGRNPMGNTPLKIPFADIAEFRTRAEHAQVLEHQEKPLLLGRDIVDIVAIGPQMGALLKRAYEIQLEEGITSKQQLKERLLQELDGLKE